jgi:putative ABC transport system permease protein
MKLLFVRRMLFRELRREYRLLLASLLPIVVGVGLIVSLGMLRSEVMEGLSRQERELMGSDLKISIRGRAEPELEAILTSIPGTRVDEVSFPSMIHHVPSGDSRLVQLKGLSGAFPFYGSFESRPASAATSYLDGESVLMESSAVEQLGAEIGDPIKIGEKTFRLSGVVTRIPGSNQLMSSIVPSVYALDSSLSEAGLMEFGIRQRTISHFKLANPGESTPLRDKLQESIEAVGGAIDTPDSRRESFGDTVTKVYEYLNLFGIAALLFGVLGASSGGLQYARSKRRVVAVLRCLGARSIDLVLLYGGTFFFASLFASLVGVLISVPFLKLFAQTFSQFLPLNDFSVGYPSISLVGLGVFIGCSFSLLFALPPILALRRVAPLEALRQESERAQSREGIGIGVIVILCAAAFAASAALGTRLSLSLIFAGGLSGLILIQFALVFFVRKILDRALPQGLPFYLRQGVSSLKRPGSETLFLCTLIGLPFFIVITLWSLSSTLGKELETLLTQNQENLVFFDVQADQRGLVEGISAKYNVEVMGWYPLISMRLSSLKGISTKDLRVKAETRRDKWFLSREYRNTFRSQLLPNEKIVAGTFVPEFTPEEGKAVPVTVEESMAQRLSLGVGDSLQFDIQGIYLDAYVSGIRRFNWRSVNPGFFVVFPQGVLEAAPYFSVITAKANDASVLPAIQREIGEKASNISLVDSRLILRTLQSVFIKLRVVVQVIGYSTLAAAILVLFSTLYLSREARQREYRVFHMLGASRGTIRMMAVSEFFFIGCIACCGAFLVSFLFNVATNKWALKVDSLPSLSIPAVGMLVTIALLVLISLFQSRKWRY